MAPIIAVYTRGSDRRLGAIPPNSGSSLWVLAATIRWETRPRYISARDFKSLTDREGHQSIWCICRWWSARGNRIDQRGRK